ncbi:hypothetical protein Q7P37_003776 [Cladosporium fusiforme]
MAYSPGVPRSPCPSPSPSATSSAAAQLRESHSASPVSPSATPWAFPFGPSSRFTHRERHRPVHTRHKSNYTPQAPFLSTEDRAHRRAQSYAGKAFISGIPTPVAPTSDCGRSPLGRFPSYPGPSSRSRRMSSATNAAPVTPAKQHSRRRSSLFQDSPFSDYFTDDARSMDSQTTPRSETQRLLVRLNKLQSQLMRGDNALELLHVVSRGLGQIEDEVEALQSQDDFLDEMDEDMFTEEERDIVLSSRPTSKHQRDHSDPLGIDLNGTSEDQEASQEDLAWENARQEKLLKEAQTALQSLTKAQEQLRQRHRELVNLNEEHSLDIEEKEMEVERLQSENESLRSDLGFDHSELLFLELQLKSLEVECEDVTYNPKLERLQRQMENWRDDWCDVEARFKKRRSRYGVVGHDDTPGSSESSEQDDDPKNWRVEVKKQGTKQVNSLTIRRVSKEADEEARLEQDTPQKPTPSEVESTPRPQQKQTNTLRVVDYVSQSTQTSPLPSPVPSSIPLVRALGLEDDFRHGTDDCAITTSPSSHADEDSEEEEDDDEVDDEDEDSEDEEVKSVKDSKSATRSEQKRTALRELWSGLTDWAGMGDEDDDW